MGTCVVVLGMHRSGTSALAGSLERLGVALGDRLLAPNADNPRGFFEHEDVVAVHDAVLLALGSRYDDFGPLPDDLTTLAETRPELAARRDELLRIARRDLAPAPLWAIKDPRLCRLLPFWTPVFRELAVEPCVVLCARAPIAVASSLAAREGFSLNKGLLLWLSYTVDAERHSRGLRRVVVDYDSLLADPDAALDRIARGLELVWPRREPGRVGEFLSASLRHHGPDEARAREADPRLISLAGRLFAALASAAARGEPPGPDVAPLASEWLDLRPAYLGWRDSWETAHARQIRELNERLERAQSEFRVYRANDEASLVHALRRALRRALPPGTARHRLVHAVARRILSGARRP